MLQTPPRRQLQKRMSIEISLVLRNRIQAVFKRIRFTRSDSRPPGSYEKFWAEHEKNCGETSLRIYETVQEDCWRWVTFLLTKSPYRPRQDKYDSNQSSLDNLTKKSLFGSPSGQRVRGEEAGDNSKLLDQLERKVFMSFFNTILGCLIKLYPFFLSFNNESNIRVLSWSHFLQYFLSSRYLLSLLYFLTERRV